MIHSLTFLSLHDWLIIKFPDVVINLSDGVFFSNLKICLGIFSSAFKWGGFAISFYLILFYLLLSFFHIFFSLILPISFGGFVSSHSHFYSYHEVVRLIFLSRVPPSLPTSFSRYSLFSHFQFLSFPLIIYTFSSCHRLAPPFLRTPLTSPCIPRGYERRCIIGCVCVEGAGWLPAQEREGGQEAGKGGGGEGGQVTEDAGIDRHSN